MVRIDVSYEGDLHCVATHVPSGRELTSDAPVDNQGKGESFSPTDLVATALGTCILTTMGIVARRHDWDMRGATASVEKSMVADPARRIGRLEVVIRMPRSFDAKTRTALEAAAFTCPVHKTLGAGVEMPIRFEWSGETVQS